MEVYFFQEKSGKEPATAFIKSLPPNVRARFVDYLQHLLDHKGRMTGVAFKKLHGYPMEEIRVKQSRNLHRVIIHVQIDTIIVVLHGFTKKEGEATPKKELQIAYQRYLQFKETLNKE